MSKIDEIYKEKYEEFYKDLSCVFKDKSYIPDEDLLKNAQIFLALLPKPAVIELGSIMGYSCRIFFYWSNFRGHRFNLGISKNNEIICEAYSFKGWSEAIIPFDRNEIPKTFLFKLNLLRK